MPLTHTKKRSKFIFGYRSLSQLNKETLYFSISRIRSGRAKSTEYDTNNLITFQQYKRDQLLAKIKMKTHFQIMVYNRCTLKINCKPSLHGVE